MTITGQEQTLAAALDYAGRGWFVVPIVSLVGDQCRCKRGSKCRSPGKHPIGLLCQHGVLDASRAPATIERWFSRVPGIENLGIVTGPSGLVVIDVDPRNGGDQSLDDLMAGGTEVPDTLTADTGGGGQHYLYADPERRAVAHKPAPGIDVLAGRSMFVAAPSTHVSGGTYDWRDPTRPVAPAPAWLLEGRT